MPTFVFRMFREFAQACNCRLLAIVGRAHNWNRPSGSNIYIRAITAGSLMSLVSARKCCCRCQKYEVGRDEIGANWEFNEKYGLRPLASGLSYCPGDCVAPSSNGFALTHA